MMLGLRPIIELARLDPWSCAVVDRVRAVGVILHSTSSVRASVPHVTASLAVTSAPHSARLPLLCKLPNVPQQVAWRLPCPQPQCPVLKT